MYLIDSPEFDMGQILLNCPRRSSIAVRHQRDARALLRSSDRKACGKAFQLRLRRLMSPSKYLFSGIHLYELLLRIHGDDAHWRHQK